MTKRTAIGTSASKGTGMPKRKDEIRFLSEYATGTIMKPPNHLIFDGQVAYNQPWRDERLRRKGPDGYAAGALRNWYSLRRAAEKIGIPVTTIQYKQVASPDDVFIEDAGKHIVGRDDSSRELVIPAKLGHPTRAAESDHFERHIDPNTTITRLIRSMDLGDAIPLHARRRDGSLSKLLIIGVRDNSRYEDLVGGSQELRSPQEAIYELKGIAETRGYTVLLPDFYGLHLTSATTVAGQVDVNSPITFLHNSGLMNVKGFQRTIADALEVPKRMVQFLQTEISYGSAEEKARAFWSCSCINNGDQVILQKRAPIATELRSQGFRDTGTSYAFIREVDGGTTCATCARGPDLGV